MQYLYCTVPSFSEEGLPKNLSFIVQVSCLFAIKKNKTGNYPTIPDPEIQKFQLLRNLGLQQDRSMSKHTYKCFFLPQSSAWLLFSLFLIGTDDCEPLCTYNNSALLSKLYSIMFPFSRSSCQTSLLTPWHLSPHTPQSLIPYIFPHFVFHPPPPLPPLLLSWHKFFGFGSYPKAMPGSTSHRSVARLFSQLRFPRKCICTYSKTKKIDHSKV